MKRSEWYAKHHGGGWRKARTQKRCDMRRYGLRCMCSIEPGQQFFDTNARNHYSKCGTCKINLCAACAGEELK
ncbi:hypothetical protein [Bradyrhizobium sp.]|uniref:hypothetical protein n=1 Tax=Bradyrhizobium sp. TaxID=376 RepID=UPI0039E4D1E0